MTDPIQIKHYKEDITAQRKFLVVKLSFKRIA